MKRARAEHQRCAWKDQIQPRYVFSTGSCDSCDLSISGVAPAAEYHWCLGPLLLPLGLVVLRKLVHGVNLAILRNVPLRCPSCCIPLGQPVSLESEELMELRSRIRLAIFRYLLCHWACHPLRHPAVPKEVLELGSRVENATLCIATRLLPEGGRECLIDGPLLVFRGIVTFEELHSFTAGSGHLDCSLLGLLLRERHNRHMDWCPPCSGRVSKHPTWIHPSREARELMLSHPSH